MPSKSHRTRVHASKTKSLLEWRSLGENPLIRYKLAFFYRQWVWHQSTFHLDVLDFLGLKLPKNRCVSLIQKHAPDEAKMYAGHVSELGMLALDATIRAGNHKLQKHVKIAVLQLLKTRLPSLQRRANDTADRNPLCQRLAELVKTFGFNQVEVDIIVLAYIRTCGCWDLYNTPISRHDASKQLAMALGISVTVCNRYLNEKSPLRKFGCLDDRFDLSPHCRDYLDSLSDEPFVSRYYSNSTQTALPWVMHGKLAQQHGEILKTMLHSRHSQQRFNILLYGVPGTGKTAFALSLAAELGLNLYQIKQDASDQQEFSSDKTYEFRCAALRLCNDRVDSSRSLILVDEADQLFERQSSLEALFGFTMDSSVEKGRLNTLLEELKVPCIWIINSRSTDLNPSTRRRFDYSIHFPKLTRQQRENVWLNAVNRYELQDYLDQALISRLTEQYEISAGGIDLTLRNCASVWKKTAPDPIQAGELIDKLLIPHCELMGIPANSCQDRLTGDYSLEGLNIQGQLPLQRIVDATLSFREQLATGQNQPDTPRMNLLLYGPPGTGKSEFVKFLGKSLDCPILTRMGGDLLSKYLGETEQKIRQSFAQAQAEQAILFLDEAEGMFYSRGNAQHSWEITHTNELLNAMEHFQGILICATNALNILDPATIRRFTFKLQFDVLSQDGKLLFYQRFFSNLGQDAWTQDHHQRLARIENLTPGEFRTVRQSFYYLECQRITHDQLLDALAQESRVKNQGRSNGRIGFLNEND